MGLPVLAQQAVYRCGQEYTNAPVDAGRCERLPQQAVTVISGTRVQGAGAAVMPVSAAGVTRADAAGQKQRDDMARTILIAELDKARQHHEQLQQAYRKAAAQDAAPADEARRDALRAAMARAQRDMDSLQRELERRP